MRNFRFGLNSLTRFCCLCSVVGIVLVSTAGQGFAATLGELNQPTPEQSETINTTHLPINKTGIVGSSLPQRSEMFGSFGKGIIYCLGVLLILLAIKHKIKLKNTNNPDNPIHILAKKAVGYRVSMMLVEVEGKKFLVSHNGDSVHLISEITDDSYLTAAGQ